MGICLFHGLYVVLFVYFVLVMRLLLFPVSLDGILDHGVSLDLTRGFIPRGWGFRCFSDKLVTCLAFVTPDPLVRTCSELIQRSCNRDSFIG